MPSFARARSGHATWFKGTSAVALAAAIVLGSFGDGEAATHAGSKGQIAGISDGSSIYRFRPAEKCFMRKINKRRARHGMRKLKWDPQMSYVARRHAHEIASERTVRHDYQVGNKVTRWRRIGQNTGAGGACRRLFKSFWHSSTHRSNILGRWRHMGVGAIWNNGRLYVQQLFESRNDPGNVWSYPSS